MTSMRRCAWLALVWLACGPRDQGGTTVPSGSGPAPEGVPDGPDAGGPDAGVEAFPSTADTAWEDAGGADPAVFLPDAAEATADQAAIAPVREAAAAVTLADAINDFGVGLHLAVTPEQGETDQLLSPASAWIALAMVAEGARGETADEMKQVLGVDGEEWTDERRHAEVETLLRDAFRTEGRDDPTLLAANAVWVQEGLGLLPEFEDVLKNQFGAEPETTDFTGSPDRAARRVNRWVSAGTRERIPEIISKDDLNGVLMVLANALYFEGKWTDGFSPERTESVPFHLADGGEVDVSMMQRQGTYGYYTGRGFSMLELTYRGRTRDLGMVVVLPSRPDGLPALEEVLADGTLRTWINRLARTTVNVGMPRFKLGQTADLVEPLKKLGMPRAFSDGADFSGMTAGAALEIGLVRQMTRAEVDEEGTVAAAATVVTMRDCGVSRPPNPVPTFWVDRPFLFVIRDRETGLFLFLGRVMSPGD